VALARLDDDEKGVTLGDTLGGKQRMATETEPGRYTLVHRSISLKPTAATRKWLANTGWCEIKRDDPSFGDRESNFGCTIEVYGPKGATRTEPAWPSGCPRI
jgi:hypothetical protein